MLPEAAEGVWVKALLEDVGCRAVCLYAFVCVGLSMSLLYLHAEIDCSIGKKMGWWCVFRPSCGWDAASCAQRKLNTRACIIWCVLMIFKGDNFNSLERLARQTVQHSIVDFNRRGRFNNIPLRRNNGAERTVCTSTAVH